MKKKLQQLFTGSAILVVSISVAQPTLTATGINPVVGDAITQASTAGFSAGMAGAGQMWNFATLTSTGTSTANTVTVASTTNGASFPMANVATQIFSTILYNNASSTALQYCGRDVGVVILVYSDLEDQLRYPFNYNDTYIDTFVGSYVSAGNTYYRTGKDTVTADGWGTLITPNGTYTNVMRVHGLRGYQDSAFIAGSPSIITTHNDTYVWYKDGIHDNIAYTGTFISSTSGTTTNGGYVTGTVGITENDNAISFDLFPNPTSSQITITFSEEQTNTSIKVMDVTGREIRSWELGVRNGKSVTLDMSGYAKGIYFVRIEDEKKNVTNKKIIKQ